MGFKEAIQNFLEKRREKKERMKQLESDLRIQKIVEDRQKSSNERELERYMEEERQKQIKENLEVFRKERDFEMKFLHNPLATKNIIAGGDFEVLKQKNIFKNSESLLDAENLFFWE